MSPSFGMARLSSSGTVDEMLLDIPSGQIAMINDYGGAGTMLPGNPPPRN